MSSDQLSQVKTPTFPIQRALDDFGNVIFIRKPDFEKGARQRGYPNTQSFIGIQQKRQANKQYNKSLQKASQKTLQNLQTNQSIKQEQIQQQPDKDKKINHQALYKKPYQIISAFNTNKKNFKNYISKQKLNIINNSESNKGFVQNLQKPSYEQVCERNNFLQQQNRNLLLQNIKLKYKIQILQNENRKYNRSKECMPNFLKARDRHQKNQIKKKRSMQIFKKQLRYTEWQTSPKNFLKDQSKQSQIIKLNNNIRQTIGSNINPKNPFIGNSPRGQYS